jgi:hypothetical protein
MIPVGVREKKINVVSVLVGQLWCGFPSWWYRRRILNIHFRKPVLSPWIPSM